MRRRADELGSSRSIVNLAMLGALKRPHELKLHVKGP
jgi:alkylhydroperoxidase/carboxymuconolactone decarboxylase family protein YurZ